MTKKRNELLTKSEALKESWRKRKDFLNEEQGKGTLHNVWRSKVFTIRGKKAGFPDSWKTYKGFKEEVKEGYSEGMILIRIDTTKQFATDNFMWANKGEESMRGYVKLTYKGEEKNLHEWAKELDLNYNGLKIRYSRYKDTTPEQILFGKRAVRVLKVLDKKELKEKELKYRVKSMLRSYRLRDKKKELPFDITEEYLRDIMLNAHCVYCGTNEKIGLDRISNNEGHIVSNVLPCCNNCNLTRGNRFSVEEMKEIGKVIKKINNDRRKESTNLK